MRLRSRIERGSQTPSPGMIHPAPDGRVMEVLSEHQCQGWLEGVSLPAGTVFLRDEAFIHIIDSMLNQHAKWLKCAITFRGDDQLAR